MNEKDWELLTTLHEERSITKAAKRLFFTQPSASAKVKQIEKELGCTIVNRSVRGISFTPQGEILCQFAERHLQEYRQLKNSLISESQTMTGTLNLGSASLYSKYKMTTILQGFGKAYPGIHIRLRTNLSQAIYDLLCSGRIQVGIIRGDYPWSGMKYRLRRDPYCILNAMPLDAARLPEYPMIYRLADRPLQSTIHDWWTRNYDRPPTIHMETNSLDMCLQMVRAGLGYTIISEAGEPGSRATQDLWRQKLMNQKGQPLLRSTWIYLNENSEKNPIVKAFYNYIVTYESRLENLSSSENW